MGSFKPNRAGIMEVCRSEGMQSALLELAQGIADGANDLAEEHCGDLHISSFRVPPFAAHADVLSRTAVGAAHTNGKMGRLCEGKFKCLSAQNH